MKLSSTKVTVPMYVHTRNATIENSLLYECFALFCFWLSYSIYLFHLKNIFRNKKNSLLMSPFDEFSRTLFQT